MTETLSRTFAGDLEVRASTDGRTVHGIVVPYGQVARVSDGGPAYDEMFAPGAFTRDIQARNGNFSRVKLLMQHNSREPIGVATVLREDAAGLYGEFRVSDVSAGNEALQLLRDGVLDSFSVGFRPVAHEKRAGVTVRTKASIRESSLVTFPAYEGALVGGLRAAFEGLSIEERFELLRQYESGALPLPVTTPDEDSDPAARSIDDPASATPDATPSLSFRHLRKIAREKGII
jgi:uncharacterized protein